MSMYTYKNTSDQDLVLVGIGEVEAGGELKSAVVIENSSLKLVDAPEQSTVQQPEPEAVEATPVTETPAPAIPKVQVTVPDPTPNEEGVAN